MKELLSKYEAEVDALEKQHLEGRRVLPEYDSGRPVYSHGRPAVRVKKDPEPTYTAYYAIRLFELWNDLRKELVDHVEPGAKKPKSSKERFELYVDKGLLGPEDDCWRLRRNRWVHEGEMPDAETFAELLARVRRFLVDAALSAQA